MNDKGNLVNNLGRMKVLWASALFLLGSAVSPGATESCPQPPTAELQAGPVPADAACTLYEIETAEGNAVGSTERMAPAFPGRGPTEFRSAPYRQSLQALSQATEGMGDPSKVERAQCDMSLILNP
jgi:hypothetical protein